MASSIKSSADPVAEFARRMATAATELGELDDANRSAGRVILAASVPPHRTGALGAGQTARVTELGIELTSTVRYWTFVHFGAPAAGTRAQPWYAEAIQRTTDQLVEVYAAHARDVLDHI